MVKWVGKGEGGGGGGASTGDGWAGTVRRGWCPSLNVEATEGQVQVEGRGWGQAVMVEGRQSGHGRGPIAGGTKQYGRGPVSCAGRGPLAVRASGHGALHPIEGQHRKKDVLDPVVGACAGSRSSCRQNVPNPIEGQVPAGPGGQNVRNPVEGQVQAQGVLGGQGLSGGHEVDGPLPAGPGGQGVLNPDLAKAVKKQVPSFV